MPKPLISRTGDRIDIDPDLSVVVDGIIEHRTEDRIAYLEQRLEHVAEVHDKLVDQINAGFRTLSEKPHIIHANQLVTTPREATKPRRVHKRVVTDEIGRITDVYETEMDDQ